jgi:hypothetical protein
MRATTRLWTLPTAVRSAYKCSTGRMENIETEKMIMGNKMYIDSVLFADDQILLVNSEDELQYNVMKLNRVLQSYDVKIPTDKMKSMAMEGRQIRRVKIIINCKLIEQVNSFKYLGCNIATHKMNMDLEDKIEKYNKMNGNVTRHFGKNMRPEMQVRTHNVLSKPAMMYECQTWILRSQDCSRIETSQIGS